MSAIGLDVGTSRVKAVRFGDDWQAMDAESEPTQVSRLPGGRCEQDMASVWAAAARVVSAVAARCPDPVAFIAVTAQGDGCWLVDGDGNPAGPALLWNDSRARHIVDAWAADGTLDAAFAISGCSGAPGLASAQLRWLRAAQPAVVDRSVRLLSCGSWVYRNLTGREVLERSDAANPFFDAASRTYDDRLLDMFGIGDLARLLPPAVAGADAAAPLCAAAATRLGMPSGTPVVIAPYDVVSTAVGTGVVTAGQAFAVLGTTLCVGIVADEPALSRAPNGMTLPAGVDGSWLIAYATLAGTEVLDWIATLLGLADAAAVVGLAGRPGRDADGSGGPLLLPYLSPAGERSPFLDPDVRGTLLGLQIGQTRGDIARAAVDGLTLAVRDCVGAAGTCESLAVSGGGARSAAWCQAISDAVGVPVVGPDVDEVGARGAVLVGATALGQYPSLTDAVRCAVRPGTVFWPDDAAHRRYDAAYAEFVSSRDALRTVQPG